MKRDMLIMWAILVVVVAALAACGVIKRDNKDKSPSPPNVIKQK